MEEMWMQVMKVFVDAVIVLFHRLPMGRGYTGKEAEPSAAPQECMGGREGRIMDLPDA